MKRRDLIKMMGGAMAASAMPAAASTALHVADTAPQKLPIWFNAPAARWIDALPVGNGNLGAMVFGGTENGAPTGELLQLNDDTFWSGFPRDGNNRDAKQYLPLVREAVFQKKDYHLADDLCHKMQGLFAEAYQPLADLRVDFHHTAAVTGYRRELDLDTACARVSYRCDGVRYTREVFISAPDKVLVLHVTADKPGVLHATLTLDSLLQKNVGSPAPRALTLLAKAPVHIAGAGHPGGEKPIVFSDVLGEGMYGAAALAVELDDGHCTEKGGVLTVEGATSFTVRVTSATGYRDPFHAPDTPAEQVKASAQQKLAVAITKPLAQIRAHHIADHQQLFRRVSLHLGAQDTATPTDQRLIHFEKTQDPALLALYFQYGRYLLIASSRPGTQPANLQGIWNDKLTPPWSSNWTGNINIQMNYWPAETTNLSECAQPLFGFISDLAKNGTVTAQENYGLPGWCAHHNIDLWRASNPMGEGVGAPTWASWCMSGTWLCAHLYEHYQFTGDIEFLRAQAYPLMRGSAEFLLAWLVDDGNGGLTTCPSVSTENTFLAPDGKRAAVSAGCTMDIALIRELFTRCIAAGTTLKTDAEFSAKLKAAVDKLPPYRVGRWGQLQEWSIDFDESTPGQRHMSHMYPLFPGDQITPRSTPELARAARASLDRRLANGGAYTGWSRAWAINFCARLQDGDKSGEMLSMLMQHSTSTNLFDTHPTKENGKYDPTLPGAIFQIDGNFGATAAIAEMLLQSHDDCIELLPALPTAWSKGRMTGLRARGGATVDIMWAGNKVTTCILRADRDGEFILRAPKNQKIATIRGGTQSVALAHQADGSARVHLRKDTTYRLHFT